MKILHKVVLWYVLAALWLLAVLSIVGAFLGAVDAKAFFNSLPLVIFWFVLAALVAAGFVFFRRLVTTPGGLAMHLGTVLVLVGAMWGSEQAHAVRSQVFTGADVGPVSRALGLVGDKVPAGFMLLHPGESADQIVGGDKDHPSGRLPYLVRLNDFRVEYYQWGLLVLATVEGPQGQKQEHQALIDWKLGQPVHIPFTHVQLTVLESLEHARAASGGGAVADPESPQPALKILLECEGRSREAWLVPPPDDTMARLPLGPFIQNAPDGDEAEGPDLYFAAPRGDIKAYKSAVTIIEDHQPVAEATIEVNRPLHWGGYHLYQYNYDHEDESFTVLRAVSDSGLWAVYLGLFLLVFGTFWRFWAEPVWRFVFAGGRHGD
jgi:hypothetical protein